MSSASPWCSRRSPRPAGARGATPGPTAGSRRPISAFGSYELRLTFLVTLITFLLPGLFVVLPLRLALGDDGAGRFDAVALTSWLQHNRGSMVLGVFVVVGLGGAVVVGLDALTLGEHTEAPLASLEAGMEPPSRWVTVRGALRRDLALSIVDDGRTTYYVPLVLTAPMRPAVFVELSDWELDSPELSGGAYEGLLAENGLPGLVRTELERAGMLAPRHYTLDWRASPSDRWAMAAVFAVIGVIGLVLLVLVRLWVRLRG